MDCKVVIMPHGRFEGVSGRLLTDPAHTKYKTPCIVTLGLRYYPADVLWAYAKSKTAKMALEKAGYRLRNDLGSTIYLDLV